VMASVVLAEAPKRWRETTERGIQENAAILAAAATPDPSDASSRHSRSA